MLIAIPNGLLCKAAKERSTAKTSAFEQSYERSFVAGFGGSGRVAGQADHIGKFELMFKTVVLLIISNIFMTIAWYGHLKYKTKPLLVAIVASWSIALFEYIFQVPANRIGAQTFTVTQLKIMQECITLTVFTVIAYLLFGQSIRWNHVVSYLLLVGAVYFSFAF